MARAAENPAMTPDPAITRVADLIASGATRREVELATRGMTRLCTGSYAELTSLTAQDRHLLRARALTLHLPWTVMSHLTAAAAWGLPVLDRHLEVVHLSRAESRVGHAKSGPRYRLHTRVVTGPDTALVHGTPTTTALRTILDCGRLLDLDWGVVVADAALRAGLCTSEQLTVAASGTHRLAGSARARALPGRISTLAESPGETLLRMRLCRMRARFREQAVLDDVPGRPRVDFLVEGCAAVEFDGRAKYQLTNSLEQAYWDEKSRQDRIMECGYEVLRVNWSQLWDEPALRERILRTVGRAHARRSSHEAA